MIIHSIELKNFLGTRKISDKNGLVKIDLPKDKNNIILIKGENGLGKSTILENLTPYSSMLKRDLKLCINYPAHKKIVIEKNKTIYHLETFFEDEKTKKGYIYIENEKGEKNILEDTKKGNITEFDYQVEKIFGDFNKFKNSSYLKQGATDIVEAKPSERLEIINKFMPTLEIYDQSKNYCQEKSNILKSEIDTKNIRKKNIEEFSFKYERIKEKEKNFSQNIIDEYKHKKNGLELKKDEFIKIEEEKKHLLSNIETKEKNNQEIVIIDGLDIELLNLEEQIIEIDEKKFWDLNNLNNNLKGIKDNLKKVENNNILFISEEELNVMNNEITNLISIEKDFIKEKEFIKNKEEEKNNLLNEFKNIVILDGLQEKEKTLSDSLNDYKFTKLKNFDISKRKEFIELLGNNILLLKTLTINDFSLSIDDKLKEQSIINNELNDLYLKKDNNLKISTRKEELLSNINKSKQDLGKYSNVEEKITVIEKKLNTVSEDIKNLDIKRYEDFIEDMKNFSQTFKNIETKRFNINIDNIEEILNEKQMFLTKLKSENETNVLNKTLISNIKNNIQKEQEKIVNILNIYTNEDLITLENDLESLNKKIYRLEDLSHNINHLENECVCPTCNKPVEEKELKSFKEDLKSLEDLKNMKNDVITKINECKKNIKINEENNNIKNNILLLNKEIDKLIVTKVEAKDIEKIEIELNDLIRLNKDYLIIAKEIDNLKKYSEFIINFDFTDLDSLYEELKVIFNNNKTLLVNEKNNLDIKNNLEKELNVLIKDKENKDNILLNIENMEKDSSLLILSDINLEDISNKEKYLLSIKNYIKELEIFNSIEKSLKNLEKIELFEFLLINSDNEKNICLLNELFLLKKDELEEESNIIKTIDEINNTLIILRKDIETNNSNVELKKNMSIKINELENILNKDRIVFDSNKLAILKEKLEEVKENNLFINNLKENLLKIDLDITKYKTYKEILEVLTIKYDENIIEINKIVEIKTKNEIIKNNINNLKEKIQNNLLNINTFNNNIKDIEISKEKISQLKDIDFNMEEYNNFIIEFDLFNEELKKFLIDKTDIEIKYKEYEELEKEIKILEEEDFIWKRFKAISLKIKKSIISSTFAEITDSANEILENEGTISLKLSINQINDKKFEIKAIDTTDGEGVSDISLLSGAEAMAVTKAISFSLSKKTEHKVLWLDESDGVLSKANKNLFVDMLKKLWDNFDLDEIFVISHQEEVEKMVDVVIDLNKLIKK